MPGEDRIRSFIAIELPGSIRDGLRKIQDDLEGGIPRGFVKWVRPEGMHLTLKFLGNISAGLVDPLKDALSGACSDTEPFSIAIGGAGAFPNVYKPRVLWIGIEASSQLKSLRNAIEEAAVSVGCEREKRSFSPHLTLGRIRSPRKEPMLTKSIEKLSDIDLGALTACSFTLFRSELKPSGAHYHELGVFRLRRG
ncbi:RNA 2',3'-cyclic phosphodiesterase [Acidobacteriota bacterium]